MFLASLKRDALTSWLVSIQIMLKDLFLNIIQKNFFLIVIEQIVVILGDALLFTNLQYLFLLITKVNVMIFHRCLLQKYIKWH